MHEQIARITSTFLGVEDHGIFTATIQVDYGGSAQGIGQYDLRGAGGSTWLMKFLAACGGGTWESLVGRTILVLKEHDGWNSRVVGVEPLPFDDGEPFIFEDWEADA